MANNKTLLKAIERKSKRLARRENRLRYLKWNLKDTEATEREIAEIKTEILNCQNQINLNMVMRDVQRDKETKGTKRVHDAI